MVAPGNIKHHIALTKKTAEKTQPMSSVIIYMSLHGCTEKAAVILKELSWKKPDLVNLKNESFPDLDKYDTIIIGGSIHIGEIQGKIKSLCEKNEEILLTKRLGLYLCHMSEGEKAVSQFNSAYSQKLRNHAVAKGLFGGEVNITRMNNFEKAFWKNTAGVEREISRINLDAIKGFGRVIFHLDKT